jgi:putative tricarboxylic transport membrane protein
VSRASTDLLFGLVLCFAGVAIAVVARAMPSIAGQAYGPGFFPSLLAVGLAASGLIMVTRSILQMSSRYAAAPTDLNQPPIGRRNLAALVWVVGGLAIIGGVMDSVGFLICVPVFMIVFMVILGERLAWSVVLSLASTSIAYYAFAKLLKVQVPIGLLDGLF